MRTLLIYADTPGHPRQVIVQAQPEVVAELKEREASWPAITALGQVTIESAKIVSCSPYV